MSAPETLTTPELQQLAQAWREQALRGVREARGLAHEYEVELRRRLGRVACLSASAALDLRPLDQRAQDGKHRSWWKFW